MRSMEMLKKRFFGFATKERGTVNFMEVAFVVGIGFLLVRYYCKAF